jgi:hypothetical protein
MGTTAYGADAPDTKYGFEDEVRTLELQPLWHTLTCWDPDLRLVRVPIGHKSSNILTIDSLVQLFLRLEKERCCLVPRLVEDTHCRGSSGQSPRKRAGARFLT